MTTTNKETNTASAMVTCYKCAGSGLFSFKNGSKGVCFACHGVGFVEAAEPATDCVAGPCASQVRMDLRRWYKLAREGRFTFSDVTDAQGIGWTLAGFSAALDAVPGSREAFRAIGWAV